MLFNKNNLKVMNAVVKNEKGATLIELLVAVIIFSAVMTAVIGILISAIKANKRIVAKQENIDSARYSIEFMIKELRMAKEDTVTPTNPVFNHSGGVYDNLTFNITDPANTNAFIQVTYSWVDTGGKGEIRRNGQPISSKNVNVTSLKFFINNWDLTNSDPSLREAPLITISIGMKGTAGEAMNETVNLQSSVAPRIY